MVGLTFNCGVDAVNGPWSYARVKAAVIHRGSLEGPGRIGILVLVPSSRVGGDLDGGVLR